MILSGSEFLSDEELKEALQWSLGQTPSDKKRPPSTPVDDDDDDGGDSDVDIDAAIVAIRDSFKEWCESDSANLIECTSFVARGKNVVEKTKMRPQRHPVILILDKRPSVFCFVFLMRNNFLTFFF